MLHTLSNANIHMANTIVTSESQQLKWATTQDVKCSLCRI